MKHLILSTLLLITILSINLNAQQITSTNYNQEFIHEDFNQEGKHFKIVTTTDNYFILDKGDYLLSRNNNESEYAIIANNSLTSNFILKTAVRLGPSNNKKASIGIILKAQQDGKGAIIFEINKKGEYRIKQLIDNTYKILSGRSKQEGWIKSKTINGVDEHNYIEIRTENNIYDVYVNSDYLTTFFVHEYTNGSCGLIISAETKARVAYYYINTKGESTPTTSYAHENTSNTNTKIEELNRKINTLEANSAKLNLLNTEARGNKEAELKSLIEENNKQAGKIIDQEKEILSLNMSIPDFKNSKLKVKSLEKKITENRTLINNLTNGKNELSTNLTKLNKTITSLNTKNVKLTAETIQQEKEIITLRNNAENADETTTKLNIENKESLSKINSLNTKNIDLAAVTIQQEKEINTLRNNTENTDEKIINLNIENKESLSKINSLNTKNIDLAAVTIQQEKEISTLRNNTENADARITKLNIENKKSLSKINRLNSKNTGFAAVTIEQEKELASLISDITDLKTQINNTSSTNKLQTKNIDSLKQQVALEKSVITSLKNDFNKVNKSSNIKIKKLTTEINNLKNQINTTKNKNTSLSTDLLDEKTAHSTTKNGLSKSITNKITKINALETQLNIISKQLKSANENGNLSKECAKNLDKITKEIKNTNQEITVLESIINKHDIIVNDLNSQLILLKVKELELNTEVQALGKKTNKLEKNNFELKELFIKKDFEVNGIKPSELTKQTNILPVPRVIKGNNTIFAVQIGVFMKPQASSTLKALDEVWYETTEQGTYVYLSGEFKKPQEATAHKNKIVSLGYQNAFVVTLTK